MARKKKTNPNANPMANDPLPSNPSLTYQQVDYIMLFSLEQSPTGQTEASIIDFGTEEDDAKGVHKDRLPPNSTMKQIQSLLEAYGLEDIEIMVEYYKTGAPGEEDKPVGQIRLKPVDVSEQDAGAAKTPNGAPPEEDEDLPQVMSEGEMAVEAQQAPPPSETRTALPEDVHALAQPAPDPRVPRRKRGGPSVNIEHIEDDDMVIPAGLDAIEEQVFIIAERQRRMLEINSQKLFDVMAENARVTNANMAQGVRTVLENVGMHDETTRRLRHEIFEAKAEASREKTVLLEHISKLKIEVEQRRAMHFNEVDALRKHMQGLENEILKMRREQEQKEHAREIQRQLQQLDRPQEEKDMWTQFMQMGIERFGPRIAMLFEDKVLNKIIPAPTGAT